MTLTRFGFPGFLLYSILRTVSEMFQGKTFFQNLRIGDFEIHLAWEGHV